jgi:hypothetical protein
MTEAERVAAYRPACGSEGADFMDRWCGRCEHDRSFREESGDSCTIAADTMVYNKHDPEYPREWRQDGPEGPRCTAFKAIDPADQPIDPSAAVADMFPDILRTKESDNER